MRLPSVILIVSNNKFTLVYLGRYLFRDRRLGNSELISVAYRRYKRLPVSEYLEDVI